MVLNVSEQKIFGEFRNCQNIKAMGRFKFFPGVRDFAGSPMAIFHSNDTYENIYYSLKT